MKKIVFLCSDIVSAGGIERIVTAIANLLICRNFDVTIISMCSQPAQKMFFSYIDERIKIIHGGIRKPKNKIGIIYLGVRAFLLTRKVKNINGADFVIGTFWNMSVFFIFLNGVKRIAWEHVPRSVMGFFAKAAKNLYCFLDAVVCLTQADLLNHNMNNVRLIPNCNTFEIGTNEYNQNSKSIVALGRLDLVKGFDLLLQVAVSVKAKHPDWHIDIYGEGDEKDNLQSMISELKIDDFVTIKDFVSDVKNVLQSSSIYVMSSRHEGLPMVLLEAQCCGLPMISFDCQTGPSEIITDGVNGYLVPPGNIKMLAEKINYLIENPEKRLEMSINSRRNAENYTPEKIAKKWIDLFESL